MMERAAAKFFCDEHLGKLARWMRIVGLDTAWERSIGDGDLLARAAREDRVVLTRDTRLKSDEVEVCLLAENYPALQLREVVARFGSRVQLRVFSRCAECNLPVHAIGKDEIRDQVPPYVFRTQEEFTTCPGCGKVFWKASHHERVDISLRDILGEVYKKDVEGENR